MKLLLVTLLASPRSVIKFNPVITIRYIDTCGKFLHKIIHDIFSSETIHK